MSDWQIEPEVSNQVYFCPYVMQDNTNHVQAACALNWMLYFNPQSSSVQTTETNYFSLFWFFGCFFPFYSFSSLTTHPMPRKPKTVYCNLPEGSWTLSMCFNIYASREFLWTCIYASVISTLCPLDGDVWKPVNLSFSLKSLTIFNLKKKMSFTLFSVSILFSIE